MIVHSLLYNFRKSSLFFLVSIFLLSTNERELNAQASVKIPLVRKFERGIFRPTRGFGEYMTDTKGFKFDSSRYTISSIWKFTYDQSQSSYNKYIRSNRKDTIFELLQKRYGWDTSQLIPSFDNSLYVFAGIKKDGRYVIIPDINANKNFADDGEYFYRQSKVPKDSLSFLTDKLPVIELSVSLHSNGKLEKRKIAVQFIPKAYFGGLKITLTPKIADSLIFLSSIHEYLKGDITIAGIQNTIVVRNSNHDLRYNNKETVELYLLPKDQSKIKSVNDYSSYNVGDTMPIESALYKVVQVDPLGKSLNLSYAGKNLSMGIVPGLKAKYFSGTNIVDKRTFNLNDYKGNYLLMDFWGTWCAPCKEILPDIKNLASTFKEKNFKVLSIAYDQNVSIVKQFLDAEKITWDNYFEPFGNTSPVSIINTYKVQSYPTTILIDPTGKILYRATNTYEFKDIKLFVENLFK